jgi:parallel beta-helix repeat protein
VKIGKRDFEKAFIFAVLFATLACVSIGTVSAAQTHYVNPGESIQTAVDNANAGDTIIVKTGTYTESIIVYKRLTIQSETGADSTIVHAVNSHIFNITADYVNITGFTIEDIIANNTVKNNGASGISLMGSNKNIVANNTAKYNGKNGIILGYSNDNRITDNDASNNINFNGIVLTSSSNNKIRNNIATSNHFNGIGLWKSSDENIIANNTAEYNGKYGILLKYSNDNKIIANNTAKHNGNSGIILMYSNDNEIRNNTANSNHYNGILLNNSNNNRITDNDASNTVNWDGISLSSSCNNEVRNNVANSNNYNGIVLWISSDRNIVANNTAKHNGGSGIIIKYSNNNKIYLNNFMDNGNNNAYSIGSTNAWNSPSKITYTYKGSTYINYLGNYWDDYTGTDGNGDGLGDAPYSIDGDKDNYPLMQQWENYFAPALAIFDTGEGTYPSIQGTHEGEIILSCDIEVSKMYTYSCVGTGGHTKSIEIYDEDGDLKASGTWNGYQHNWHNITITPSVTLKEGHEYRYVIETGSYPQIIHVHNYTDAIGGTITCDKFTDVNGKIYTDWIPAIRLE